MTYTLHIIDPIDNPDDDNCDVQVTLPDGRAYLTNFITVKNLTTLMRRWQISGEHGGGLHFSAPGTIIVERLDETTFREVIDSIVDEQAGRLTPQFTPAHGPVDLDTRAVDAFVAAAREFCETVEQCDRLFDDDGNAVTDPASFLRYILRRLAALYTAGLALPEVEVQGDDLLLTTMSHEEWSVVCRGLSDIIGKYNMYWTMLDSPYVSKDDHGGIGTISDDLADTYRDVKGRLDIWDSAEPDLRQQVIWEWRFNFVYHYGQHILDSMRAIHRFVLEGYL
ncbi:MAG TPA: DUF5063 domain-containing protein [Candidatus Kapabacteria bacterium]|nr:DUF5063 domain-containing protein [Candidatus Kapabacteria bacterium]